MARESDFQTAFRLIVQTLERCYTLHLCCEINIMPTEQLGRNKSDHHTAARINLTLPEAERMNSHKYEDADTNELKKDIKTVLTSCS